MNQQISHTPTLTKRLFPVALIGVLVSLYLLHHHLEVKHGYIVGKSICNINQYFDCDSVVKSPSSEMLGIPVALLGSGFFFSLCFLFYFFRREDKVIASLILLFSTISLIPVIYLASFSVLVLGKVCLFCAFVYLISLTLFLVSYLDSRKEGSLVFRLGTAIQQLFDRRTWNSLFPWFLSSCAIFVFLTSMQSVYVQMVLRERYLSYFDTAVLDKLISAWEAEEVVPELLDVPSIPGALSLSKGRDNGKNNPFVVVEFGDYECPFCQKVSPILDRVYALNKSVMDLHVLNFPIDMACNPGVTRVIHENACALSEIVAAKALESVDLGYALHKQVMEDLSSRSLDIDLFKSQHVLSQQSLEIAKTSVLRQIELGTKAGVQGTPALFVNGKRVHYDNFFQIEPVLSAILKRGLR